MPLLVLAVVGEVQPVMMPGMTSGVALTSLPQLLVTVMRPLLRVVSCPAVTSGCPPLMTDGLLLLLLVLLLLLLLQYGPVGAGKR